jgi:hypothetical protein
MGVSFGNRTRLLVLPYALPVAIGLLLLPGLSGCDREKTPSVPNLNAATSGTPKDILVFPAELKVDDPALNDFVATAMRICASGNYEDFRRLWSAREEPMSREEFNEGWQAVQEIRIAALQKVRIDRSIANDNGTNKTANKNPGDEDPNNNLARAKTNDVSPAEDDGIRYVIFARVQLDAAHPVGHRNPRREVLLLLVPEQGGWRFARAPKSVRDWIRQRESTTGPSGEG